MIASMATYRKRQPSATALQPGMWVRRLGNSCGEGFVNSGNPLRGVTPKHRLTMGSVQKTQATPISHGFQSTNRAIIRRRPFTVMATLRRQDRDVWIYLVQAWIAHRLDGVMASLLPDIRGTRSSTADQTPPR